jgi:hypothetical protein
MIIRSSADFRLSSPLILELVDLFHELLCGYYATGSERSFRGSFLFYVFSNNAIGSEVLCGCIALTNMQL